MAKVIQVEPSGGPARLRIVDVPLPEPGPGEVRFRVRAFAINRADVHYINGDQDTGRKPPSRVGSEAAGVVDAIGPGVTSHSIGDRVSSIPHFTPHSDRHGVQGEFAVVPAEYLAPWPSGFSAAEACSVWMQYLTAYYGLITVGRLQRGQWLLAAAASSSAGAAAVQMGKAIGARVIATTRSPAKAEFVHRMGAKNVLVTSRGTDFSPELRRVTEGHGVDLVYEPLGGDFMDDYAQGLAWGASIVSYGALDGPPELRIPLRSALRAKAAIHPYSMFNHVCDASEREAGVRFVMEQITAGRLFPAIDRVFPMARTAQAYEHMQNGQQCGKIVVQVTSP